MITLHFHLQPQYKYDLFHINFTSFHCRGRYELNKLTSLPMCGFIAQLVEHRTGIRGGHGFESRWSPDFFQASSFQLLKLENLLPWSFFALIKDSEQTNKTPDIRANRKGRESKTREKKLDKWHARNLTPDPQASWTCDTQVTKAHVVQTDRANDSRTA